MFELNQMRLYLMWMMLWLRTMPALYQDDSVMRTLLLALASDIQACFACSHYKWAFLHYTSSCVDDR